MALRYTMPILFYVPTTKIKIIVAGINVNLYFAQNCQKIEYFGHSRRFATMKIFSNLL